MREAAERYLSSFKQFRSVRGTAENTNLENKSIDIITAGQAFHWFGIQKTKIEFNRILKKDGYIFLIWNSRDKTNSKFSQAYEMLINNYSSEYQKVNHSNITEDIFATLFANGEYKTFLVDNYQELDFQGLRGRLFSSSYMPNELNTEDSSIINELKSIFEKYSDNGQVRIKYKTEIFLGKI